jgi:hypothetical protein
VATVSVLASWARTGTTDLRLATDHGHGARSCRPPAGGSALVQVGDPLRRGRVAGSARVRVCLIPERCRDRTVWRGPAELSGAIVSIVPSMLRFSGMRTFLLSGEMSRVAWVDTLFWPAGIGFSGGSGQCFPTAGAGAPLMASDGCCSPGWRSSSSGAGWPVRRPGRGAGMQRTGRGWLATVPYQPVRRTRTARLAQVREAQAQMRAARASARVRAAEV